MADILGIDCFTYIAASGTDASPTWALLSNIREETLDYSRSKADVSRRGYASGMAGYSAYRAGKLDATLTISMVYDKTDTNGFAKFLEKFVARGDVMLALLDGPLAVSGSSGVMGRFSVINMSNPRNLEDALIVDFELAPYVTTDGFPVSFVTSTGTILERDSI